uniref:Uncharacterized protein n=1 Tax=Anguilla anguilla TaxID=7936 RepID=A0A0E9XTD4_ANGAN
MLVNNLNPELTRAGWVSPLSLVPSEVSCHLPQGVLLGTVALGMLLWGFRPGLYVKRIVTIVVKCTM